MRLANKIKKWFGNLSVIMKLTLTNTALVIWFILLMIIIFQYIFFHFEVQYSVENAENINQLIAQRIEYVMENAEDVSAILMYNNNVQNRLKLDSIKERMDSEYTLYYLINNVIENSAGISTIILYRDSGEMICSTRVNVSELDETQFKQAYENLEGKGSQIVWEDMHHNNYHVFQDEKAAITMRRKIISQYTGESIGMITININEADIEKMYNEHVSDLTDIVIVDDTGTIVSSSNKRQLFTKTNLYNNIQSGEGNVIRLNDSRVILTTTRLNRMGWTVVRLDSIDMVYQSHLLILALICAVGISVIVALSLLIKRLTQSLLQPVNQLIEVMESPEPYMRSKTETRDMNDDEFGRLAQSFSSMQQRIQNLINDIRIEQQERVKQEIIALQTQITPHFLYNTLESVCALIQLGRLNDAMDMVKHIESFYRGILSKGDTIITLDRELSIMHQYIAIQKFRYEGKLEVKISVDAELSEILIPKLTLQPLIENAIYHGFAGEKTDGCLEIIATLESGYVNLQVRDNGEGFEVNEKIYEAGDGYGLYNIKSRMISYFGDDCALWIESRVGEGTTVHLRIPKKTRKDGERHESTDC